MKKFITYTVVTALIAVGLFFALTIHSDKVLNKISTDISDIREYLEGMAFDQQKDKVRILRVVDNSTTELVEVDPDKLERGDYGSSIVRIFGFEGVYSNATADTGGETCFGISRKSFPDSKIWKLVDKMVPKKTLDPNKATLKAINTKLLSSKELLSLVYAEYKAIWDGLKLAEYPKELSFEVFNTAVHCGAKTAIIFLQSTLNAYNQGGAFGNDLVVDGVFGKNGRYALTMAVQKGYTDRITKALVVRRLNYYLDIAHSSPSQRKFIRGWMSRYENSIIVEKM